MRQLDGIALLLLPALLPLNGIRPASAQIYLPPPVFYPPFHQPRPYDPPDPADAPVEIGGYAVLGGASLSPGPIGAMGIYAQWNRFGLCPGLDLRLQGGLQNVRGGLTGPRLAYQPTGPARIFRPYVEILTGPNEISDYRSYPELRGVTLAGAVGLDLHYKSAIAWRVIEYTKGDFSGIAGVYPQTISTGIVLHLP
jgi:hypothetical protein